MAPNRRYGRRCDQWAARGSEVAARESIRRLYDQGDGRGRCKWALRGAEVASRQPTRRVHNEARWITRCKWSARCGGMVACESVGGLLRDGDFSCCLLRPYGGCEMADLTVSSYGKEARHGVYYPQRESRVATMALGKRQGWLLSKSNGLCREVWSPGDTEVFVSTPTEGL